MDKRILIIFGKKNYKRILIIFEKKNIIIYFKSIKIVVKSFVWLYIKLTVFMKMYYLKNNFVSKRITLKKKSDKMIVDPRTPTS